MIKTSISGVFVAAIALLSLPTHGQDNMPECRTQKDAESSASICITRGSAFRHDYYALVVDRDLIFTLADDFAEDIRLRHTIPPGPTIEFPLSRADGGKVVDIRGGCVPVSKDNTEVARLCNIHWGKKQIIKDELFEFN